MNGALGFRFVRALAVEKAALDANLLPAAVRVLAAILYFMNNTTKRAWPSYERIHEITGYSRDTIERAIRQLIGSGYLFRERNAPITGGRALVHYGLRALHPSHIDRMISAAVEEFRRQRPAPEADPVKNSGVRLTQGNTAGSTADPSIFAASDPGIFVRQEPYKYEPVFSLSETPVSDHGEPGPQPKHEVGPVYTEEFETFWGQYPDIRNNSKSCAFDEWRKLSPTTVPQPWRHWSASPATAGQIQIIGVFMPRDSLSNGGLRVTRHPPKTRRTQPMKMLRLKCPECHRGGGAHEFPYPPVAARTRGFDDRGAHGRRMPSARRSCRPRR